MRLTLLQIPYDSGHFGKRMGRGPLHLVERGLPGELERQGHDVRVVPIRLPDGFATEVGAAVQIHRRLAEEVRTARDAGRFPLLLAGNCNTTIGAVTGISPRPVGVVWLDAHGDFNTPETSPSGFLDGMSLTFLTGLSWKNVARTIPGFEPVSPRDVVLVGARDLDPEEERLVESAGTAWVHAREIRARGVSAAVGPALDDLATRVPRIHFHVDLDVLDPSEGRVNVFSVDGGLSVADIVTLVEEAARRFEIASATISAYDPDHDPEDRVARAAGAIARAMAAAAS
jgi:arginase